MKFAKSYPRYQVPQWTTKYINYRALKKQIKKIEEKQNSLYGIQKGTEMEDGNSHTKSSAPQKRRNVNNIDENYLDDKDVKHLISTFYDNLNFYVHRVEDFYQIKFKEYNERLNHVILSKQFLQFDKYIKNNATDKTKLASNELIFPKDLLDDLKEIKLQLVRLISHFQDLTSFCEMNKKASYKILKKLDKKVGLKRQHTYYDREIRILDFESFDSVKIQLRKIEGILEILVPILMDVEKDSISEVSTIFDNIFSEKYNMKSGNKDKAQIHIIEQGEVLNYIQNDDCDLLIDSIKAKYGTVEEVPMRFYLNLLNTSAIFLAFNCIKKLLTIMPSLNDDTDINRRNFFHYHIITLGEHSTLINDFSQGMSLYRASSNVETNKYLLKREVSRTFENESLKESSSKISISLLYLLDNLPIKFRKYLSADDVYKKTPLHYAAEYGIAEFIDTITTKLRDWSLWDDNLSIDGIDSWSDVDNQTPMHLAILGNHPLTVTKLIPFVKCEDSDNSLISLAVKNNDPDCLRALLSGNCYDINYVDGNDNETPLYTAAKLNYYNTVEVLLKNGASTEITESLFNWTPIFIAAVENNYEIVKILLEYGAKKYVLDESGWTPLEQAILHGNLEISEFLKLDDDVIMKPKYGNDLINKLNEGVYNKQNKIHPKSSGKETDFPSYIEEGNYNQTKEIGHDYLHEQNSVLLITIGGSDSRIQAPAVHLDHESISQIAPKYLDNSFTLEVKCDDAKIRKSVKVDLPLDYDSGTMRFDLPFQNDHSHTLYFDLLINDLSSSDDGKDPCVSEQSGQNQSSTSIIPNTNRIGRAVALLNKTATFVGNNKSSLNEMFTIPILAQSTLDILGYVTFQFIIIKPFHHPDMLFKKSERYWKSLVSTRVIGHRGLGKNINTNKTLQLGENTVESFIAASSLGASYVEFDVQLTKDSVPVIYHDFLVAETGVDIPMHELTLEQFLDLNNVQKHIKETNKLGRRYSVGPTGFKINKPWELDLPKDEHQPNNETLNRDNLRSLSHSHNDNDEHDKYNDRMRLTRTFKKNNFKGNTRGTSIASSFVTLEELFDKLPPEVGFNIECKYPMVDEAEEEDTGSIVMEMNHWVDTVLKIIFDKNKNGRDIIFSSFHPDICIMLSLKQPTIPILFLTESGAMKMADPRASSLQSAIKFAREWDLLGLVSNVKPILKAPRLAKIVKNHGLVFVTYGVENNDPENVIIELNAGVDAVIVDSVLAIRKGLTNQYEIESEKSNNNAL